MFLKYLRKNYLNQIYIEYSFKCTWFYGWHFVCVSYLPTYFLFTHDRHSVRFESSLLGMVQSQIQS